MSKKTRNLTNKAGKLMKCDGQMLKKVIEAKGYKCHELSKMLRYCSDYLTTCCRTNKISDVAAKYLMDYKIFPQMYNLEGEIKVEEPKEVKIDKDDKEAADKLNKRMDMINSNSVYGMFKSDKEALAQEIKEILNRRYGTLENVDDSYKSTKEVLNEKYWKLNKDTKFGYGHVPSNPGYTYAGHEITWGFSHLMHAVMDDLKHDPEFKEMIKQAVKEAYEEL